MTIRKRYAIVGTGSRADLYFSALLGSHSDVGELVAFCDLNRVRMAHYNREAKERGRSDPIPEYPAADFDRMIRESQPDVVIVTSIDRTHHTYIVRAMELGCDVISEKPMTIDAPKCQKILDTVEKTGRHLTVTFNYRYSPRNSKVKEVIQSGEIGQVLSIHFEWLLDTKHGADYFRRWHRDKQNSGGLMVHKSTHHFDLVNWWLGSSPQTVFAMGELAFYGRRNAEARGITSFPLRYHGWEGAANDPFAIDIAADSTSKSLYLDAEKEDGYVRDQNVFADNISIEDTMGVMVRYANKAILTYSLNAHCPWEGYRVMFNGTKGRLELNVVERSYVSGTSTDHNKDGQRHLADVDPSRTTPEERKGIAELPIIVLQPHWGKPREIPFEAGGGGGHGGGDERLLNDLFRKKEADPLGRAANYVDGARSILVGIAANRCFGTGQPVEVRDLVTLPREK